MIEIMSGFNFVKVYIDDLIIFSKCEKDHYKHVKSVLIMLYDNHVSVNFDKSEFCKDEVIFLGQWVSKNGVRANINNMKNLGKSGTPKSKKDIEILVAIYNGIVYTYQIKASKSHL
ncbi:Retrovirus-related Pol polyprotein from transposon gypsy [Dictyocoela muelleri]|nr:Retrovirus-related Pol polyprotein from transposon gypsy [Dictyocoela muelleri]